METDISKARCFCPPARTSPAGFSGRYRGICVRQKTFDLKRSDKCCISIASLRQHVSPTTGGFSSFFTRYTVEACVLQDVIMKVLECFSMTFLDEMPDEAISCSWSVRAHRPLASKPIAGFLHYWVPSLTVTPGWLSHNDYQRSLLQRVDVASVGWHVIKNVMS